MMTVAPESLFPADYRSARRAFIAACEARGLDAIARVVPGVNGPDGKPLFMDSVALGPRDATRALLVIGGVHGVDGRFGSAIQTGLLRAGITPPHGARLVMIHALNPYGFAWDRWVNENNIDIDRNFIDHANPPRNTAYDAVAEALAPEDISGDPPDAVALDTALMAGQYHHPDGLFYGGNAPCWSARALAAVRTEDLARVQQLHVIDCRAGMGAPGQGQVIAGGMPGATGTLYQGLVRLMPEARVTYDMAAMGTLPPDATLRALQLANWQDCFAPDEARAAAIAQILRDAFFIDRPDWRQAAWKLGRDAVRAALAALA